MNTTLCDFCHADAGTTDEPWKAGWWQLGKCEWNEEISEYWGHRSKHVIGKVATFCSMSCVARFAELRVIEESMK